MKDATAKDLSPDRTALICDVRNLTSRAGPLERRIYEKLGMLVVAMFRRGFAPWRVLAVIRDVAEGGIAARTTRNDSVPDQGHPSMWMAESPEIN